MILYTLQYPIVVEILETQGTYRADWDKIMWQLGTFSYKWMVGQMLKRGIDCGTHPPIWAWQSHPTKDDIDALIGYDWETEGWHFITFECPDSCVVFSRYSEWNRFFGYQNLDHEKISWKTFEKRLFAIEKANLSYEQIQACLPYLKKEWVRSCRKLTQIFKE